MGETATEGQGTALAAESEVDNTHKRREWEPECVRARAWRRATPTSFTYTSVHIHRAIARC